MEILYFIVIYEIFCLVDEDILFMYLYDYCGLVDCINMVDGRD